MRPGAELTGLYVHFPFCVSKCHYCDFNSRPGTPGERSAYLEALVAEIRSQRCQGIGTVYFGGGTPTVYAAEDLRRVLEAIHASFEIGAGAEITTEANPGTVDTQSLSVLRAAGVNRVSIGVQSLDDGELQLLGRSHTSREAMDAVHAARDAGFANVSIDLIRGLPGQSARQWMDRLDAAVALAPTHMSVYGLSVEAGTELARRIETGELKAPRVDGDPSLVVRTVRRLAAAGLARYEVSNYALPGLECRHNLLYWRNLPYLGVGAGAWSYVGGRRSRNVADVGRYVEAVKSGEGLVEDEETLSAGRSAGETLMLGLRLVGGVDLGELADRYGLDVRQRYGETIGRLERAGLVEVAGERLRATEPGMLVLNAVATEFVD